MTTLIQHIEAAYRAGFQDGSRGGQSIDAAWADYSDNPALASPKVDIRALGARGSIFDYEEHSEPKDVVIDGETHPVVGGETHMELSRARVALWASTRHVRYTERSALDEDNEDIQSLMDRDRE